MISASLQRRLARMPVDALTQRITMMLECNAARLAVRGGSRRRPWMHLVLRLSGGRLIIENRVTGRSALATRRREREAMVRSLRKGLACADAIYASAVAHCKRLDAATPSAEGT